MAKRAKKDSISEDIKEIHKVLDRLMPKVLKIIKEFEKRELLPKEHK